MKDKIHTIVPVLGGFEATWGFKPSAGKPEPVHDWVTDELRPYTAADAAADALAVQALNKSK